MLYEPNITIYYYYTTCNMSTEGRRKKKLEIDNLDSIIIFEDDAYPSFNFIELQEIINYNVPNDWDIILFGGIYNNYKNEKRIINYFF